jgi:hypothetical protein
VAAAAGGGGAGPAGDPVGDAEQPGADRPAAADAGGVLPEQQEGGLEGVVGVGPVAQHPAAGGEHQPAVSPNERGERLLVPVGHHAGQQGRVRGRGGRGRPAEVADQAAD